MKFRPCIDLHQGRVKQIVGSSLDDGNPDSLQTNFVADKPAAWFAALYRADRLAGGHIIKLGPGNDEAALSALAAWPGGMQIGGGITADNAGSWLDHGASHVIVTSYVFDHGVINRDRLAALVRKVGRERLVLDLSCRRRGDDYLIVTDRWQKFTDVVISAAVLDDLGRSCDEFLIHAADVEGKCGGIEIGLIELLGAFSPVPTTYAGGIRHTDDLVLLREKGRGRLDFTIGSALDIFGGTMMTYRQAVAFGGQSSPA
ncbi:phosphoribosylformimino-5-aminoimidazole carboxamide ribotide isomerase [Desulfoprunum benzoelyticum]|uniref:Phosphoribosylformimino-5-aminoimidazole carboxamide ribotide isomerase n=1 Tax=Desulfoprunum benzoelyticum TaxID=1506996 RepID=A0A840UTR7_9BACT|nr:phosphoribosylformimino-5-aminoimidazole carboxamide ribotide isomerase [Desulfoprunum benzoelyticum]MBB5349075.1 phosphoribosylformimino-5-aminoimidazole carboxamide ribotide isomerase [Desulfoprunum benzoelyticum]MBM9531829.1 phosphoribosylformimino-5-aminoimidazole carboxamide ribotide isomerase [Desulfoprunum benzoelyticum]